MSFQTVVLQAIASIQTRLNAIVANAKRFSEFDEQTTLDPTSKLLVDRAGVNEFLVIQKLLDYFESLGFITLSDIYQSSVILTATYRWIEDYTFEIIYVKWVNTGEFHEYYFYEEITLSAPDPTPGVDRTDAIVLNLDTELLEVVEGVDPLFPILAENQRLITFVPVDGGTTSPTGVSNDEIYLDNAQWTAAVSGATINPDSTVNPKDGTKSIQFISAVTGNYVELEDGTGVSGTGVSSLNFNIYNDLAGNPKFIIQASDASNILGSIQLQHNTYGFNKNLVDQWQTIVIPAEALNIITGSTIKKIRITNNSNFTGFVDNIILQRGTVPPTGSSDFLPRGGYPGTGQTLKDDIDLKADKSNVLELDNTDAFTPTADYHPSTKKYVDDAVAGVGTGDMAAATYDPANKSEQVLTISDKGVANGVASLDSGGKVPAAQLPSYVDDTVEGYLDSGIFYEDVGLTTPIAAETGKVYVDITGGANKSYRYTGSVYTRIDDISAPEVETLYNAQVSVVSQAEAEAGTATTVRRWTAERVKQAIAANATISTPESDIGNTILFTRNVYYNEVSYLTSGDLILSLTGAVKGVTVQVMTKNHKPNITGEDYISPSDRTENTGVNLYSFHFNGTEIIMTAGNIAILSAPSLTLIPGDTEMGVSWNQTAIAQNYILQRADDSAFSINLTEVYNGDSVSDLEPDYSLTDPGLTNGQTYYYRIMVSAPGFKNSDWSATASAAPDAALFNDVAVAWSLNKLFPWSKAVLQIRRSSDNALAYVFYDGAIAYDTITLNSYISTSSDTTPSAVTLGTWVGANNAFVRTWYGMTVDDVINANYKPVQTSNSLQPQFITAGVINTKNGKPSIKFSGTQYLLASTTIPALNSGSAFTLLTISSNDLTSNYSSIFCNENSANSIRIANDTRTTGGIYRAGLITTPSGTYAADLSAGVGSSNQRIVAMSMDASKNFEIFLNGVLQNTNTYVGTYDNTDIIIGAQNSGGSPLTGDEQEIIIYPSKLGSSTFGAVNSNRTAYYSIP